MTPDLLDAFDLRPADALPGKAPGTGAPSNQQLLDAARLAYSAYRPMVDVSALALANIARNPGMAASIEALNAADWQFGTVRQDVVAPIFASRDIRTAIGAMAAPFKSYSVGCFSTRLPGGKTGMTGFARSVQAQDPAGLTFDCDLYRDAARAASGNTLQLGQWQKDPSALNDKLFGLHLCTFVRGIPMSVQILLDRALTLYGFVQSVGLALTLPTQSTPISGTTTTSR